MENKCICCESLASYLNPKGESFCGVKCLEVHYLKRIDNLETDIRHWKDVWFEFREIIGWLGYRFIIPENYKNGSGYI